MIDKLNQIATYWPPGEPDGFGGVSPGIPMLLPVRWQINQKLIRDKTGQEVVSEAIVYCPIDVDLDGKLYLGNWFEGYDPDGSGTYDPSDVVGEETDSGYIFLQYLWASDLGVEAKEIIAKASMSDLDGNIVGYKVWL